jgi:LysM domain-containing protein
MPHKLSCKPSRLPSLPRMKVLGWWAVLTVAMPAAGALAQEPANTAPAAEPAAAAPAPEPVVAAASSRDPLPQTHTVKKGDTLWDLAQFYLHDPFLWPGIYRLNTDVVEDPHWIYPGEILRIAPTENVAAVPSSDTPLPSAPLEGTPVTPATDSSISDVPTDSTDALAQGPQQPSIAESEQDEHAPLFPERRVRTVQEMLKAYTHRPYRALRRSEFYSSGFLTENQKLPYGRVLGPITPQQIKAEHSRANALPYTSIAVDAPNGATYQIGDSLLLLQLAREIDPYGNIVVPTGVLRIIESGDGHYIGTIVATYGPIRNGQLTLPLDAFNPGAGERAVPVSDGVRGAYIGGLGRQDLKEPQMVVFINKGREDGVAPGDLFEVRRRPERSSDGTLRVNELMATLQIVHARNHTATGILINVISPDIPVGTDVMQVAKLPS